LDQPFDRVCSYVVEAVSGAAVGRNHSREGVSKEGASKTPFGTTRTELSRGAWLVRARRRRGGHKGATLWSNAPSITKVRGGVKEGGPTMREGQPHRGKLRARGGSKTVESTSVRRKSWPFAGRRWKRT
jgi:hypothetical protein